MFANRNKENIELLAKTIEEQPFCNEYAQPAGFGMNSLTHDCRTPQCIAGFGAWLAWGKPEVLEMRGYNPGCDTVWAIENAAANFLGLPPVKDEETRAINDEVYNLFYPDRNPYFDATPAQAAAVLRHLGETGEIDWKVSGIELEWYHEEEDD